MSTWLDNSSNSNNFRQSYIHGFLDISGGDINVHADNKLNIFSNNDSAEPRLSLTHDNFRVYDDNTSSYIDLSNNKLQYLKDVNEDIQTRLTDLTELENNTDEIMSDIVILDSSVNTLETTTSQNSLSITDLNSNVIDISANLDDISSNLVPRAREAFSGGTGVGISDGAISIGQNVGTNSDVGFNNLTLSGNLTVNGTTTTLDTENLDVSDSLIGISHGLTGAPVNDAGILINRGDASNVFIGWDESADQFTMGTTNAISTDTGDLSITPGTLVANLSGNADTVTNGVYTTGNQTIGGDKTFSDDTTFNNALTVVGATGPTVISKLPNGTGSTHCVLQLRNNRVTSTAYTYGRPSLALNWQGSGNWMFGQGGMDEYNDSGETDTLGLGHWPNGVGALFNWEPNFFFTKSNRFGIGINAPDYPLDVNGTAHALDISASNSIKVGLTTITSETTELKGIPTAPTASSGTNTTQIATTAFVSSAVSNLVDSAPGTLDTLNELAAALGDDANYSTTISEKLGKVDISINMLDASVNDLETTSASHTTKFDVLDASVNDLETTTASHTTKFDVLDASVNDLETTTASHTTKFDVLDASVNDLETTTASHTTKFDVLDASVNDLETTTATHTTEIGVLDTTISDISSNFISRARDAISAGTGVSIIDGAISIGQSVGTTNDVTFRDLTLSGNLTVNGTTTTLDTQNLDVSDSLIGISHGLTGAPVNDAGILINRGDASNVFIGWDENADKFTMGTTSETSTSTGNLNIVPGTLVANLSGNADTVTNGVYTTGNQTIGGDKTFSDDTTFNKAFTVIGATSPTVISRIANVVAPTHSVLHLINNKVTSSSHRYGKSIFGLNWQGTGNWFFGQGGMDEYNDSGESDTLGFGFQNNSTGALFDWGPQFYFTKSHRFGIGINAPDYPLDVNGTAHALDISASNSIKVGLTTITSETTELKGIPTAPTASSGTNTTQIATTAFVSTAVSNLVDSAPGTLDTLNELAAALGDDANYSTTISEKLGKVDISINMLDASVNDLETTSASHTTKFDVLDTSINVLDTSVNALESTTASHTAEIGILDTSVNVLGTSVNALESTTVYTSGNQTIGGDKTFSDDATFKKALTVVGSNAPTIISTVNDSSAPSHSALFIRNAKAASSSFQYGKPVLGLNWQGSGNWMFGQGGMDEYNDSGESDTLGFGFSNSGIFNWQPRFFLTKNHRFGIGINAPDYPLDVNGTAHALDISASNSFKVGLTTITSETTELKGIPTAPTASSGTNTTQIATTAFVSTAVSNLVDSAPGTLDTLNELAAALGDDANYSTTISEKLGKVDVSINVLGTSVNALESTTASHTAEIGILDTSINVLDTSVNALESTTASHTAEIGILDTSVNVLGTSVNALESTTVYTSGNQTIGGDKTFSDDATFKKALTVVGSNAPTIISTVNDSSAPSHSALFIRNAKVTSTAYKYGKPVLGLNWQGSGNWMFGQGGMDEYNDSGGSDTLGFGFSNSAIFNWEPNFFFTKNHRFGIGINAPDYPLDVNGTAHALDISASNSFKVGLTTITSETTELKGIPTAPTASSGTNTTQIATTAFVSTAVSNLVDSAPGTLDTLNELAAALGDDANYSTTISEKLGKVDVSINVLGTSVNALESTTASHTSEIDVLDTSVNALETTTATHTSEIDVLDSSVNALETTSASHTTKFDVLDASVNSLETTTATHTTEIGVLDASVNSLESTTATHTSNISVLDTTISDLSNNVYDISSNFVSRARNAISAGTGVSISDGAISIGQNVGTNSNVGFNNLTLSGNLTVNGTTTTLDTQNLDVSDSLIGISHGLTGAPVNDAGILINRGDASNVFIGWDENADKFTMGTTSETSTSTGNLNIIPGTLVANLSGNADTVTNGVYTIGNQTIGGSKTFSDDTTMSSSLDVANTFTVGSTIISDSSTVFIGTPMAPTANVNTRSNQIATTNYVHSKILNMTSTINTSIDDLETTTETHTSNISVLDSSVNSLETTTATHTTDIGILDTSVNTLETTTATHTSNIGILDSSVNVLETTTATLTTEIDVLDSSVNVLETTTATLTTEIDVLDSSVNALESTTATLTTEIDVLDSSVNSLETTTATHTTDIGILDASVNALETTTATHTSNISVLDSSVNDLETTTATHTTEIGVLDSSVNDLESTTATHTSQISILDSSVNALESTTATHTSQISVLDSSVNDLESTTATHTSQISILDSSVNALESTTATHTSQISVLDSNISDLSSNFVSRARNAISAGTGVSISDGAISIGQSVGTTNDVTFNNLNLSGNLTVNGTTTTLDTQNLDVSDSLIGISHGLTGAPLNDAGILINRGDASNVFIGWNEDKDKFTMGTTTATSSSTGNLNITPGTLIADLSGNAETVTNGVYTTGNQTIGGSKTFSDDITMSSSLDVANTFTVGSTIISDSSTVFVGTPFAPTATNTDLCNNQIATTAFVQNTISSRQSNVNTSILDSSVNTLESTTATHTDEISVLDTSVNALESTTSSHTTNISVLDASVNALETTTATHTSNISILDSSVNVLESTTATHTSNISILDISVNDLESTTATHTSNISVLDASVNVLESTTATHTTEIGVLDSSVNVLESTTATHTAEISVLDTTISDLSSNFVSRARNAISAGTGVTYNTTSGAISIGQNVGTNSDVEFKDLTLSGTLDVTGVATAPTASIGTNTTQIATTAFVSTAVSNLVDSAPGTLDTLNELAAALGDDANYSTTISEKLGKVDISINIIDSSVNVLESTTSSHTTNISVLDSSVNVLESTTSSHTTNISVLDSSVNALESTTATHTSNISILDSSVNVLESTTATHTSNISILDSSVNVLESTTATHTSNISILDASVNVLESTTATHTSNISILDASVNVLESTTATHTDEISILDASVNVLESTTATHTDEISVLDTSVNALESTTATHTSNISILDISVNALETTTATHTAEISVLDTSVNALETTTATHTDEISVLDSSVNDLESTTATHTSEISILDASVNALETTTATHTDEISVLDTTISDLSSNFVSRARNAISAGTGVTYNTTSGAISIGQNVGTNSDVEFKDLTLSGTLDVTGVATAPTASIGTNTTQIATTAFVSTAVSNLVDSAPGTLDTLNELAAALGDDANYSTTISEKLGKVDISINILDASVNALESTTATHTSNISILDASVNALESTTATHTSNISILDSSVNVLESTTATHTSEISILDSSVNVLESTTATHTSNISILDSSVNVLESTTATHTSNISILDSSVNVLESTTATHTSNIGILDSSVNVLESTTATHTVEISILDASVNALESTTATHTAEISVLDSSVNALESTTATHTTNISVLDSSVNVLESTTATHTTEIDVLDSSVNALESTTATHTTEIGVLDTSVNALESTTATHTTEIGVLDTSVNALESTTATHTTNISVLDSSVNALETTTSTHTTEIGVLDTSVNALETTTATHTTEIGVLDTSVNALETTTSTHTAEISILDSTISDISSNFVSRARNAISAGTGVSITDGTISIGQSVGTTNDVTFKDLTLSGNLTVNGTTTTLDTQNLDVSDSLIGLSHGLTGAPVNDSGILINRGDSSNVFIGWNEDNDKFTMGTTTATSSSTGNLNIIPGTLVADLSGNAETVTNGVYTTGNQTIEGSKTFSDATTINNTVVATGDVSFNSKLNVDGILSATDINASGSINIGNTIISSESTSLAGIPTAPTADIDTSSNQIATTAFVQSAIESNSTSTTLAGTPTAPTADIDTSSNQIATTAFVQVAIESKSGSGTSSSLSEQPPILASISKDAQSSYVDVTWVKFDEVYKDAFTGRSYPIYLQTFVDISFTNINSQSSSGWKTIRIGNGNYNTSGTETTPLNTLRFTAANGLNYNNSTGYSLSFTGKPGTDNLPIFTQNDTFDLRVYAVNNSGTVPAYIYISNIGLKTTGAPSAVLIKNTDTYTKTSFKMDVSFNLDSEDTSITSGIDITEYDISYTLIETKSNESMSHSGVFDLNNYNSKNNLTFNGLKPGSKYRVQIRAKNALNSEIGPYGDAFTGTNFTNDGTNRYINTNDLNSVSHNGMTITRGSASVIKCQIVGNSNNSIGNIHIMSANNSNSKIIFGNTSSSFYVNYGRQGKDFTPGTYVTATFQILKNGSVHYSDTMDFTNSASALTASIGATGNQYTFTSASSYTDEGNTTNHSKGFVYSSSLSCTGNADTNSIFNANFPASTDKYKVQYTISSQSYNNELIDDNGNSTGSRNTGDFYVDDYNGTPDISYTAGPTVSILGETYLFGIPSITNIQLTATYDISNFASYYIPYGTISESKNIHSKSEVTSSKKGYSFGTVTRADISTTNTYSTTFTNNNNSIINGTYDANSIQSLLVTVHYLNNSGKPTVNTKTSTTNSNNLGKTFKDNTTTYSGSNLRFFNGSDTISGRNIDTDSTTFATTYSSNISSALLYFNGRFVAGGYSKSYSDISLSPFSNWSTGFAVPGDDYSSYSNTGSGGFKWIAIQVSRSGNNVNLSNFKIGTGTDPATRHDNHLNDFGSKYKAYIYQDGKFGSLKTAFNPSGTTWFNTGPTSISDADTAYGALQSDGFNAFVNSNGGTTLYLIVGIAQNTNHYFTF